MDVPGRGRELDSCGGLSFTKVRGKLYELMWVIAYPWCLNMMGFVAPSG